MFPPWPGQREHFAYGVYSFELSHMPLVLRHSWLQARAHNISQYFPSEIPLLRKFDESPCCRKCCQVVILSLAHFLADHLWFKHKNERSIQEKEQHFEEV